MTEAARSMNAAQVAERFLRSKDWLYRARPLLERKGFPRPIPAPSGRARTGRGRPEYVWDRAAVEAWFALQAPPALHAAMGLPAPANDHQPASPSAERLERRFL